MPRYPRFLNFESFDYHLSNIEQSISILEDNLYLDLHKSCPHTDHILFAIQRQKSSAKISSSCRRR
jgi:hypothetical protein